MSPGCLARVIANVVGGIGKKHHAPKPQQNASLSSISCDVALQLFTDVLNWTA
jgi:hypothetical protein